MTSLGLLKKETTEAYLDGRVDGRETFWGWSVPLQIALDRLVRVQADRGRFEKELQPTRTLLGDRGNPRQ